MRLLRWFILAVLLVAAVLEPEAVRCSDEYGSGACDNPQGYAEVW